MAARYWVGGAGNWSSTTKWSATSGGASGASVPTSGDAAIFDANSGGKFTATVDTEQSVDSITITPSATVGVLQIALSARLTTNNLTTTGTAGNNRIWFRGNTFGVAEDFVVNGTVSISDCDFRDVYVTGTTAPIAGTRIGDLRGCRGITFDAPKTVYWVSSVSGNWSGNNWGTVPAGAASTNNFPLAQDTAAIVNGRPSAGQTITIDFAVLPSVGTVDASTRTNTVSLNPGSCVVYGDWRNGTGVTLTGAATFTFSGRTTQTITSAGRSFPLGITIDSFDGTVQLADAFSSTNSGTITVTNGTFDTAGYAVNAGAIVFTGTTLRSVFLRGSTVTLNTSSPLTFGLSVGRTFDAGTSTINLSGTSSISVNATEITFNNVAFTSTATGATYTIVGTTGAVFNNLSFTPATFGVKTISVNSPAGITINGTLTVSGTTPVRRFLVSAQTLNVPAILSVGTLSATDCDFRDITITGAAAGSSPTRAGDCGGNSGINFPASKTVYWNLSGTQGWGNIAWATTSGGTPNINNFPLAQDTAVFDNAGAVGTVTTDSNWAIGTVAMGSRTTAMTLSNDSNPSIYGDWTFGTGVTTSSVPSNITFRGRSTQTITSNGVVFNFPVTLSAVAATVQLSDALTLDSTRALTVGGGTFNAVTYNVTAGTFNANALGESALFMGSGTWTLSGTGTVWSIINLAVLDPGTANITLSNTSTTARTFGGGGRAYNKLTIGGATGTSTLTIQSNNTFTELDSTKTVAHTIALGTSTQVFGKWSVTGTSGNVVTLTGTGVAHFLAGPATSGIDYLAMGSIGFSAASPGEFYAGANSTGTAAAPVFRAAPPAPRTVYWVGGTGNWSDTARWSTSSGGASGAAVPTSLDDVVFNSLSNATAYTATINVASRCSTLTIAGPASGNITLAGTSTLAVQNSFTLPATNLTRTFIGAITLSGTGSGKVFTTNGVTLASAIGVYGIGASWTLGSALNMGASVLTVNAGAFSLSTYNLTAATIVSNFVPARTIDFGSGTTTLSSDVTFGTSTGQAQLLTVIPGTSQINLSSVNPNFQGNSKAFNNVTYTGINFGTTLTGGNTFNNLTFNARTSAGTTTITFTGTTTVTGTLSKPAGADATRRHVFVSNTVGSAAILNCAAVSLADVDFRDITISGAAAPASGTRLGDRKGNTGITFDAPKTVYWNLAGSQNWSAVGWATTIGGTPNVNNLPLAQDTAVFTATSPASGSTITFDQSYAVGTIDMSARTTNTLTLSSTSGAPFITGNWINGTGSTMAGVQTITFGGRTSQTITSAGRPFTQGVVMDSPGGSLTLQDAFETSRANSSALGINNGTFDANNYNVTLSAATAASVNMGNSGIRAVAVGSGTWTLAASGTPWNVGNAAGFTVTGTGTITLTSASAKTFVGGGVSYAGITLDQGGAGTLTISGNNTFADITNTYKSTGATSIDFSTTTQQVVKWTAAGEAGRLLTISGNAAAPANLFLIGATDPDVDYLVIQDVRAFSTIDTWYAGNNSVNNGSLGWYFQTGSAVYLVFVDETASAVDSVIATVVHPVSLVDSAQTLDQLSAIFVAQTAVSETAQATDAVATTASLLSAVSETSQALDTVSATAVVVSAISETSVVSDTIASDASASRAVSETATAQDTQVVAASEFTASFVDTTTAVDSVSTVQEIGAAVADTALALDVTASVSVVARSVADAATGTDTASGASVIPAAYADTATVQDVQAVAASAFNSAMADTAAAADATASRVGFVASVADTVVLRDTTSTRATQRVSVAESITASDTDTATVIFRSALAETAVAQDTTSTSASLIVQFTDSAAASEIVSSTPEYGALVEDAATGSDDAQAAATVLSFVAEQAEADAVTAVAGSVFSVDAFEQAVGQDLTTAGGEFFVSLAEFATISDQNLSKFLWNPIPDVQVPDWQIINDTQAANWQIIDDEQPAVWTPIST